MPPIPPVPGEERKSPRPARRWARPIALAAATIRNADRIIALVNGIIVEEGNHETLLAKKGEYFRLYHLQFKDEGNDIKNERLAKDLE